MVVRINCSKIKSIDFLNFMKHYNIGSSLRVLFLSLSLLLSMSMLGAKVEIDGVNYELVTKAKQAIVIAKGVEKYYGTITIPESVEHGGTVYSVTEIGQRAFYDCSALTSVVIPNSVTSIGNEAFLTCFGLASATIGNSVRSIGEFAFLACSNLATVTIPNSVTSLGYGGFSGCSRLTELIIGNSVTNIGNRAFEDCFSLTTVSIPNSVERIGDKAFENCVGLKFVSIGNNVTSIGEHTFDGCYSLISVTIPNNVTDIGAWAFHDCSGLTSVTIGNSVTSIGELAFHGCSALTSVFMPNSVTSIGNRAFQGCSALTSVIIGNGVRDIGESAFQDCSNLKFVTIGSELKFYIESHAFANCPALLDFYSHSEHVPYADSNAFEYSDIEYCKLHVPEVSIESYRSQRPWRGFGKIIALSDEESGVISVEAAPVLIQANGGNLTINGVAKGCEIAVYTLNGTEVTRATATEGSTTINTGLQSGTVAIVKLGNKSVKVKI